MNFEEHAAKPLLGAAGIAVPEGALATSAEGAADIARRLGEVVVKAQVPAGKRGKAGGIKPADTPAQAAEVAARILGMRIGPVHGGARVGRAPRAASGRVLRCRFERPG